MSLVEYLKGQDAKSVQLVKGPNGAFISATKKDNTKFTMPVGKKSQNGTINEFNVLITPEGVAIATMNNYSVAEEITL